MRHHAGVVAARQTLTARCRGIDCADPDPIWPAGARAFAPGAFVPMALGRPGAVYTVTTAIHARPNMRITAQQQPKATALRSPGAATLAPALALPRPFEFTAAIRSMAPAVVAFAVPVTAPATPWLVKRFAICAPRSPSFSRKPDIPQ